jgi:hypothetical protein
MRRREKDGSKYGYFLARPARPKARTDPVIEGGHNLYV